MFSFWAGGISSFSPCAREYRLLRRPIVQCLGIILILYSGYCQTISLIKLAFCRGVLNRTIVDQESIGRNAPYQFNLCIKHCCNSVINKWKPNVSKFGQIQFQPNIIAPSFCKKINIPLF